MEKNRFIIRAKIWIENCEGKVVFGLGRYRMLEAVDRHSSLHAAAKELKMSYRALWGRIKASEKRLGKPLVESSGRGTTLTPFARQLMDRFRAIQEQVCQESDECFKNMMVTKLDQ